MKKFWETKKMGRPTTWAAAKIFLQDQSGALVLLQGSRWIPVEDLVQKKGRREPKYFNKRELNQFSTIIVPWLLSWTWKQIRKSLAVQHSVHWKF